MPGSVGNNARPGKLKRWAANGDLTLEEAATARSINEQALLREYYEILKIVGEFDGRLMTVKGWGVTLSLAALAWGFQYSHYGLFLVASLSGLGFWLIEGAMKRHQMRFYLRMREIEVLQYQQGTDESARAFSSPGSIQAGRMPEPCTEGNTTRSIVRPPFKVRGSHIALRGSFRMCSFHI